MDRQTQEKYKSTGNDNQSTPSYFFDFLDDIFHFDLDVCATAENSKCERYYDGAERGDGLVMPWDGRMNWCNPPYSRPESACSENKCRKKICKDRGYHIPVRKPGMIDWCEKAHIESVRNRARSVILTPVKTDTTAFRKFLIHSSSFCFVHKRLNFGCHKTGALQPSMLSFMGFSLTTQQVMRLSEIGTVMSPNI